MKTLFYTLLVSLLIGCGGNSNSPKKEYPAAVDNEPSHWVTEAPDYFSKVPYTMVVGTYRYYAQDKGTYPVYNIEKDTWEEVPLTTEFGFKCDVTEEGRSATLVWEKGNTEFVNPHDDVRSVIFVNGEPIVELDGVTTDLSEGYLNIDKNQLSDLLNKMANGGKMEVQIISKDMEFSQVAIIRLKGFDRNHQIFECFE